MRAPRHRHDPERAREEELRRPDERAPEPEALLALQRSAGNRAVAGLLARGYGPERVKRAGAGTKPRPPRYLGSDDEPTFGKSNKFDGGSWVKAMVGPSGGDTTNYGSTPVPGECSAVESLNGDLAYRSIDRWIKGHLLNDNLGGPGLRANLTPMTDTANKRHQGSFEGPVKTAITRCNRLGNPEYSPIKGTPAYDYWYGIDYRVKVDGNYAYPAGPAHAKAVNTNLVCTATYIKQEKGTTTTEDLDDDEVEELKLPDLPAAGHNSPCV